MSPTRCLLPLLLGGLLSTTHAEAVKDREGAVRKDKADMQNDARWIYNDWQKGFTEAKRTGKPLLIVLRCVPCLSCQGLDASVLTSTELTPLLDQFVCVRLINANAIELAKFQFDYDLSFSTLFFNADGTLYGRYGSWTHQKDPQERTTVGYKRSLEAALAIHTAYPVNKAALAGKQGGPTPFATPIEIPLLATKYKRDLDWEGKVVGSCVHCHQVGDAYRAFYRDAGKPLPSELIYPMPMPETIGVSLEPDQIAKVKSVAPGSIAAKAGVQVGDEFTMLGGQLLLSIADFAWALHRAGETATLPAQATRSGKAVHFTLNLPTGWRAKSDISRRVGTWPMRGMATGGMILVDLTDEERTARGLGKDKLGLFVKGLGQYGKHAAAKNAGFQKDDVLIELNGQSARLTEGEMIGQLLQNTKPGDKMKAAVLRGYKRVELILPMQ